MEPIASMVWQILLVDEDEDEYILTREYLSTACRTPYVLEWRRSYGSALEAILDHEYHVILMDHQLEDKTGLDLIQAVRASGCKVPIVMLTGHGDSQLDLKSMQAGANDFLNKAEVTPALLERAIRYAIWNFQVEEDARVAMEERQAQLEAERARLITVIENAPTGIVMTDRDGKITVSNPAAGQLFPSTGITGDAFGPVSGYTLLQGDRTPFKAEDLPLVRSLGGEQVNNAEMIIRHEDGREVFTLVNSSPIYGGEKNILGVVGVIRDITERRKTEEALLASEEREREKAAELETLMDAVPAVMWITRDPEARYIFANRGGYRILGMQPGGNTSKSAPGNEAANRYKILKDGQEVEVPLLPVQLAARGISVTDYELELLLENGDLYHLLGNASPLLDKDGNPTGAVSAFIDITTRKKAEQALLESQEQLQLTTQAAQIGTFTWITGSNRLLADSRSCELLGIPEGETLTYKQLLEIVHPEDRQRFSEIVTAAVDQQFNLEIEFRVVWKDGSQHYLFAKGRVVAPKDSSPATMLGVAMDITNLRALQAQTADNLSRIEVQRRLIEQREQERLQIARDLHDGPLQHLISMAFSLDELAQETSRSPRVAELILQTRHDMQQAIAEIRSYASELRPPTLANFGFEKAVRAHLVDFRKKHRELTIQFDAQQEGGILSDANRMALYRIYQETLNNVIKHSQATQVHIRFQKNLEKACLEIRDNGIGFVLPKDWVELARQQHLGLVGIRERAQAAGGWVEIETAPGEGTTIRVTIPVREEDVPES